MPGANSASLRWIIVMALYIMWLLEVISSFLMELSIYVFLLIALGALLFDVFADKREQRSGFSDRRIA